MADVFISYAREDKAFAHRLCEALKQKNRETWIDAEGILPSAEWRQEIFGAIEAAGTLVQIVSPHSVESKICRDELSCAVNHNKRIIPILYAEVEEESLPDSIRERQWIPIRESDDFDAGLASLLTALDTNIEWVRSHTRLLTRAIEWDKHARDYSYALRGVDLKKAEAAVALGDGFEPKLLPLQIDYILASRKAATKRAALGMAAATVALISVIIFGAMFLLKRQESALNLASNFREMGIS